MCSTYYYSGTFWSILRTTLYYCIYEYYAPK